MRRAILIVAAIAIAPPVLAQPVAQDVVVLGEGTMSCSEFVSQPNRQILSAAWVLGYISGANSRAGTSEAMTSPPSDEWKTIVVWLQNFCRSHARDMLVSAAENLRQEYLTEQRGKAQ